MEKEKVTGLARAHGEKKGKGYGSGTLTAIKGDMVMVAGGITTQAKIDYDKVVRGVVGKDDESVNEGQVCDQGRTMWLTHASYRPPRARRPQAA